DWNSAADWYFHNNSGGQGSIIDSFMAENQRQGMASMITLPMLGWVSKDGKSVSYPRDAYPKQDKFEGAAGNGAWHGKNIKGDPMRTSIAISPEWVGNWVKKLKTQFGDHPHFYILDNEPMLWNSTHRDVQDTPVTYDYYLKKYIAYAAAVREADPAAVIVGPAEWGWLGMQGSAFDMPGPWSKGVKNADKKAHGNKPFLEWFLEQVAKEEKSRKVSLLDIIDVHYYPEKGSWPGGGDGSSDVRAQLLQSTRSLWDKTYKDPSWINDKIYFIPRLKAMAAKFKPEAKVSIGEYNFRAEKDPSGAIAQADVLGIMGREDLYAAEYWDFPVKDGTHRDAFALYRNFDGKGSGFGARYVPNSLGVQDDFSVFTAEDLDKKRLTIILLNKNLSDDQEFDLQFDSYGKPTSGRVVGFNGGSSYGSMTRYETDLKELTGIKIKTKPLSMQIVELLYGSRKKP
ncbi:MAG: glycoside hydrolase family 44 protein, partial [Chitinophagaceae bacterium]|nr:glycoside hydrolase family 44 protein [Oligoflexus sp.]